MFIFSARNFHSRRSLYGKKKWRQKMESIYGAGFWSVCHGYDCLRWKKHLAQTVWCGCAAGPETDENAEYTCDVRWRRWQCRTRALLLSRDQKDIFEFTLDVCPDQNGFVSVTNILTVCWHKAKTHYTGFPVASLQQVGAGKSSLWYKKNNTVVTSSTVPRYFTAINHTANQTENVINHY